MNYFPHSGEKSYIKFLDSKLMKPFMDKLCKDHNKNKDEIVKCILTNLESEPYQISDNMPGTQPTDDSPPKKTSDYHSGLAVQCWKGEIRRT
jgi:hypothetical protein